MTTVPLSRTNGQGHGRRVPPNVPPNHGGDPDFSEMCCNDWRRNSSPRRVSHGIVRSCEAQLVNASSHVPFGALLYYASEAPSTRCWIRDRIRIKLPVALNFIGELRWRLLSMRDLATSKQNLDEGNAEATMTVVLRRRGRRRNSIVPFQGIQMASPVARHCASMLLNCAAMSHTWCFDLVIRWHASHHVAPLEHHVRAGNPEDILVLPDVYSGRSCRISLTSRSHLETARPR